MEYPCRSPSDGHTGDGSDYPTVNSTMGMRPIRTSRTRRGGTNIDQALGHKFYDLGLIGSHDPPLLVITEIAIHEFNRFYVEALVDTPCFYELGARYCEAYRFAYRFLMEAKIDFKYESIRKVLSCKDGREELLVYLDALLLGRDVPAPAGLQRY